MTSITEYTKFSIFIYLIMEYTKFVIFISFIFLAFYYFEMEGYSLESFLYFKWVFIFSLIIFVVPLYNFILEVFKDEGENESEAAVSYSGPVVTHYAARTLTRKEEYDDQDPPCHALYPHGYGEIYYARNGKIIESYKGEFEYGQYSGEGVLNSKGNEYKGLFSKNKLVNTSTKKE